MTGEQPLRTDAPMIKVNQLTAPSQADQLRAADVLGVCICRDVSFAPGPCATLGTAQAIHAVVPDLPLSVAFNDADDFTPMEIEDTLVDAQASFFEFTPVDFAKTDAFAQQLELLNAIDYPKVANGCFLLRDDLTFLDEAAGFAALRDVGVECFQFEIRSAVVPSLALGEDALARVDAFFATLPVLVADQVARLHPYPLTNPQGMYFNLRPTVGNTATYDFTELTFPLSRIRRVLGTGDSATENGPNDQ